MLRNQLASSKNENEWIIQIKKMLFSNCDPITVAASVIGLTKCWRQDELKKSK